MKLVDMLKGVSGYWMTALAGLFGGIQYSSGNVWGIVGAFFAPGVITALVVFIYLFKRDRMKEAIERVKE